MSMLQNFIYMKEVKHMDDFQAKLQALSQRVGDKPLSNKSSNPAISPDNEKEVLFYETDDGDITMSVFFYKETFWLTQKSISELFDTSKQNISYHLQNIFSDGELDKDSVVKEFLTTAADGKNYKTLYYNLDAVISVGYRVNSIQATRFRQWATNTLKEYIVKGFVMNDELLKNGPKFGKDYFDELLERIKEIRASERRFYQKITDIYAQCSYDYDSKSPITQTIFQTVQNKLIFAITGHTAPEIIHNRADSSLDHMGLTTWKNAPDGKILKSDVTVSKNYLNQKELSGLNDIVAMYLDYAENQAKRQKLMSMQDWVDKLDSFLQFNEYELLKNLGTISREVAEKLAVNEYKKYRVHQDTTFVSDFDKATEKYLKK